MEKYIRLVKIQYYMTEQVQRAGLFTAQSGDIARGKVVLEYSDIVYRIEYDTVQGPDGLSLMVKDDVGDLVQTEDQGTVEAPEYVIEDARKTLSQYHREAVQGEGAVSQGNVVFSGIVGFTDGWTPTR